MKFKAQWCLLLLLLLSGSAQAGRECKAVPTDNPAQDGATQALSGAFYWFPMTHIGRVLQPGRKACCNYEEGSPEYQQCKNAFGAGSRALLIKLRPKIEKIILDKPYVADTPEEAGCLSAYKKGRRKAALDCKKVGAAPSCDTTRFSWVSWREKYMGCASLGWKDEMNTCPGYSAARKQLERSLASGALNERGTTKEVVQYSASEPLMSTVEASPAKEPNMSGGE